ncbi:MAG: hypothetical protein M1428_04685 [Deltaproteobacteria bacterium]|nr:hypothetical protein [Deltaproteobacteria bacterium]
MDENYQKLIKSWPELSNKSLEEEIIFAIEGIPMQALRIDNFVSNIYPSIEGPELRSRVDEILLKLASAGHYRVANVCAKLQLNGTKEIIIRSIKKINNLKSFKDNQHITSINDSIKELQLKDAEGFLIKELEWIKKKWVELSEEQKKPSHTIKIDQEFRKHYAVFITALPALEVLNPGLASQYEKELQLPSPYNQNPRLIWDKDKIPKWRDMSDDELEKEVAGLIKSKDGSERFRNLYIYQIKNDKLKERVANAFWETMNGEDYGAKIDYLYDAVICKLPQAKEHLMSFIANKPIIKEETVLSLLSNAISVLKAKEAAGFLTAQVEDVFTEPEAKEMGIEKYFSYHKGKESAFYALQDINPEIFMEYKKKIREDTFKGWKALDRSSLKTLVKNIILNTASEGSAHFYHFVSEYYNYITDVKLKDRINDILLGLIDDMDGVGGQVIELCLALQLSGIEERILNIINNTDRIFEALGKATEKDRWAINIIYVCALDHAIEKLNIVEAKDFLIKQLYPLKGPKPIPPETKEYYFYRMCTLSALRSLEQINPDLAQQYDLNKTEFQKQLLKIDTPPKRVNLLQSAENFLFLDMGTDIKVVDIADQTQPRMLGTFLLPEDRYDKPLICNYKDWVFFNVGYQGVFSVNKNTLSPIQATSVPCLKLQHLKDDLFVGATGGGGGTIYQLTSMGGLNVVSVIPQIVTDFVLHGNYLFCACLTYGFKVFDLSNINKPQLISDPLSNFVCTSLGSYNDKTILVKNDMGEMYLMDISNPFIPKALSSIKGRFFPGRSYFIHYPFLIVRMYEPNHILRVFDCSEINNPRTVFTYPAQHLEYIVHNRPFIIGWAWKKYLYSNISKTQIASQGVPFEILKLSPQGELKQVISIENMDDVYTANLSGDHLYIAKTDGVYSLALNEGII